MKLALVVPIVFSCVAIQASGQDIEGVKQIDRVCLGRMLIVQTMATDKEHGRSEQEYRNQNPFDPRWKPAMKSEVNSVISYVFAHSWDENMEYSGAVMQACYEQNKES